MTFSDAIQLIRPHHWIKNIAVLLPVVFGMKMGQSSAWMEAILTAVAFCLVSSAGYILNDIQDAESDRQHPTKKERPIAAGRVNGRAAFILMIILIGTGLLITYQISGLTLAVLAGYGVLQILYSLFFKHKAILDVIIIAIGFVLRAAAGAVAIQVVISPWLFVCMFTICLFMGFCKRYNEAVILEGHVVASSHRRTMGAYNQEFLTHLITLSAGIAVMSFLMYGLSPSTIERFRTDLFVYTLPLIVYAVFRFAMLSMKGRYADPTELILKDLPFQLTVVLWLICAVVIVGWGHTISEKLSTLY